MPWRTFGGEAASVGQDYSIGIVPRDAGHLLLLGIDVVASDAEPVHCWVGYEIPAGYRAYWDSQSTGEGLGVRFPWRGQVPLLPTEYVVLHLRSDTSIDWSWVLWGLLSPFPANMNTA